MRSDVAFLFLMILGLIVVNSSVLIAVSEVSGNSITGVLKEEERPNQLFDITFEIDDSLILNINELVTRVTFESFGTVPTPVNLTYIIVDEMGKTLHVEKDYLTVETEKIFTKKFEGLDLDYGKYAIYLKTLYNVDVEDDFVKRFEIRSKISKSLGQLFDIKFSLVQGTVKSPDELVAHVIFESFGTEPTPVNLKYAIINDVGDVVYLIEENTIVETEKILTRDFKSLVLDDGEYTLILTTLNNNFSNIMLNDFHSDSNLFFCLDNNSKLVKPLSQTRCIMNWPVTLQKDFKRIKLILNEDEVENILSNLENCRIDILNFSKVKVDFSFNEILTPKQKEILLPSIKYGYYEFP